MITSPNLALKIWNLSTDPYDSGQLADNWAKVDQHDHSPGKGLQVPTGGIADAAITQAKIAPGVTLPTASIPAGSITTTELQDGGVQTIDLATGAVTTSKLATGAVTSNEILNNSVTDVDLVSPNNATYKQIYAVSPLLNALSTGTYVLNSVSVGTGPGGSYQPNIYYLNPADYTVGGKTNKYRLRVSLATNATAATSTFTFGLYPVSSVAGGVNVVVPTLGAVTAGSTCAFAPPSANARVGPVVSTDFTAPAAGFYALGVAITGANMAAGSAIVAGAILQHRQV